MKRSRRGGKRSSASYWMPKGKPNSTQKPKQLTGKQYPLVVKYDEKWVKYYFEDWRIREVTIKYLTGEPYKRLPVEDFDQPQVA